MRSKKSGPVPAGTGRGAMENHRIHFKAQESCLSIFVVDGRHGYSFRPVIAGSLSIALGLAILFQPAVKASADSGGSGAPETVILWPAAAAEAAGSVPLPAPEPIKVDISETDAEILARLLWSSPLNEETQKRQLCWLVFNRVDDERLGLFGRTVESVVIRREFPWFDKHAHISDTNIRIAREELRRWALYLMGAVRERPVPVEYVYAGFEGHHMDLYAEIGGAAWSD